MKVDKNSHLTEMEKNIIYGTPFKEDEKPVKRKQNQNVKSWLPKISPPPNYNGLPDGFL